MDIRHARGALVDVTRDTPGFHDATECFGQSRIKSTLLREAIYDATCLALLLWILIVSWRVDLCQTLLEYALAARALIAIAADLDFLTVSLEFLSL